MIAFREFLTNFYIGAASGWDIFIILIFLIGVLLYGFFLGRNRIIILILGSYFSLAIIKVFPWSRLASVGWLNIDQGPSASTEILFFLALILFFYFWNKFWSRIGSETRNENQKKVGFSFLEQN